MQKVDEKQRSESGKSVTLYEEDEFYEPENLQSKSRFEEIFQMAKNWKPIEMHDDYRAPDAAQIGGFILNDPVVL